MFVASVLGLCSFVGPGGLVTSGSPLPHVCSVRSRFMFLCGCLTYRLFFLRLLRACVKAPKSKLNTNLLRPIYMYMSVCASISMYLFLCTCICANICMWVHACTCTTICICTYHLILYDDILHYILLHDVIVYSFILYFIKLSCTI